MNLYNEKELKNIIEDIHDNRIKESLIDILKKKEQQDIFTLNISHDLRAPLNIIMSVVQLIELKDQVKNDEKLSEYLKIMKRNSFKMLKLIDNLIDIKRLEKDHYPINKKLVEIVSFIESLIVSIDKYAKQKKINIIFDTNKEEAYVSLDPQALDRIIINLISNAIKFSSENSNIYINLFIKDNTIQINIKDEGEGISKEEQELIFNRFAQANKYIEHKGSGIGLDLVQELVKAHNGTVSLNSKLGEGSEFIIKIPNDNKYNEKYDDKMLSNDKVQLLEVEFSDIYL